MNRLHEEDAVRFIETWHPNGCFGNEHERQSAYGLASLLGGLTLALNLAMQYLRHLPPSEQSLPKLNLLLGLEGLARLPVDPGNRVTLVMNDLERLRAIFRLMLKLLSPVEIRILTLAAHLPPEQVALPWVRDLTLLTYPELDRKVWTQSVADLHKLGLLETSAQLNVSRMDPFLQELMLLEDLRRSFHGQFMVTDYLERRVASLAETYHEPHSWEVEPLGTATSHWLDHRNETMYTSDLEERVRDRVRKANHPKLLAYLEQQIGSPNTVEIVFFAVPQPARINLEKGAVVNAQLGLLTGNLALAVLVGMNPPRAFVTREAETKTILDWNKEELASGTLLLEVNDEAIINLNTNTHSAWLSVAIGDETKTYLLKLGVNCIGRSPLNDVVIPVATVAGRHVTINYTSQGLFLKDLGSSNGTYVGEEPVNEYWLKSLDVIQIGEVFVLVSLKKLD